MKIKIKYKIKNNSRPVPKSGDIVWGGKSGTKHENWCKGVFFLYKKDKIWCSSKNNFFQHIYCILCCKLCCKIAEMQHIFLNLYFRPNLLGFCKVECKCVS